MTTKSEDTSRKPYLCGGVFFTLLLKAYKDLKQNDSGLKDASESNILWDLNMVANRNKTDWSPTVQTFTSMKSAASYYKHCAKKTEKYTDLGKESTRDNMECEMEHSYDDILQRMSTFVSRYLFSNPEGKKNITFKENSALSALTKLVGSLIYIILNDGGIQSEDKFRIRRDECVSKADLCDAREFELQIFLLEILYFIVKSRPDNKLGRETITNWLEESSSDEDIKKISQNITLTVLPYTEPDEGCNSNKSHKENKPGIIEYSASSGSLTYHSGSTVTAAPPHQHPRISPESKSLEPSSKYKLLECLPDCRFGFAYRNHERAAIGNIFAGGEHVVFLYGEAGQGKTELAKQYASSYRKNNPNAAVVFAVYTDNIETTIRDRITIPGLSQDKDNEETNKAYYLRKLEKLMEISDKNTLLIIDDFNVDSDPELESFLAGPYKVIFTTRNPHHQYKDREVEVGVLGDVNVLLSVFREYYETESESSLPLEDIPYVRELIERFHCHTYMVELLAKQLAASHINAEQLLQRYEQYGIHHPQGETVEGHSLRRTPYEHIRAVFSVSSLSEEECSILREMTLLDIHQIEPYLFEQWAQLKDYKVIDDLINKSWIRSENRVFSIHPLVRDVFCADPQQKPDTDNCGSFLEELGKWMYHAWGRSDEDNRKGIHHILSVARYFGTFKKGDVLIWSRIPDFLWQVGRFEDAVNYGEALYKACVSRDDTDCMDTGYAARILGECYYNWGKEAVALKWFERARDTMEAGNPESDDLAWCYERLSQGYTYQHDLEKAMKCAQKVRDIREALERRMALGEKVTCYAERWKPYTRESAVTGIAMAYQEIARVYLEQGNYEQALENAGKAVNRMAEVPDDMVAPATKIYPKFCLGLCYYRKGFSCSNAEELQTASRLFKECLSVQENSLGSSSRTVLNTKEYLADTYAARGMSEDAKELYANIRAELENHYPNDIERREEVQRKAESLSAR